MLVFVVPIKSAQVSTNWEVFSLLVGRTMRSICQQSSNEFKVVAVCHEIPDIGFEHPALEFISVDFEPPTDEKIKDPALFDPKYPYRNVAKEEDKARKILAGFDHGKSYNPDYFMVVDADDCIHRDLANFVAERSSSGNVGWYLKQGFIYNEGSKLIFWNKNTFNELCGTCLIVHANYIDHLVQRDPFLVFTHDFTELDNKNLEPLPFNGAIYSIGNTENYCSTPEAVKRMNSYGILKKDFYENIVRKLSKYRVKLVTKKFRDAFGLSKLDFSTVFS